MRRITSPLMVGRTVELRRLEEGLERAASGGSATFLVAGEAGVGKSRLVEEFTRRAEGSGAHVLAGDCMDAGNGALAYAAMIQVLRSAAAVAPPSVIARLPQAQRAELAMLVPDLDPHAVVPRHGGGAQARLFDAILNLLAGLARHAAVILVIEDLHWSDRSTREFLAFAVRGIRSAGIVLVATYRDDEIAPDHPLQPLLGELERQPDVERLDLTRLGPDEVRQLVDVIVDGPADAELSADVAARSDGNPFFIEELLAAGRTEGELPRHLTDLLRLRVDATPPGTQQVIRAAAVGGQRVDDRLLDMVVGIDQERFTECLRDSVAHHILVPFARGYTFRHALVREAVEGALLPGERQRLHVAWAEAHGSDDVGNSTAGTGNAAARAYHWSAADRPLRALPASYQAAVEAEAVRAYAAAAGHYQRTLALWDRAAPAAADLPDDRVGVAERAADASNAAGDDEMALEFAQQALAHLGPHHHDPVRVGLLEARLGFYLMAVGRSGAQEAFERALRLVPADPPSPQRASVLGDLALVLMLTGHDDHAEAMGQEALEIARAVGPAHTQAQALSILGAIWASRHQLEAALVSLREALGIAQDIGDPDQQCRAHMNLSYAHNLAGDLPASLASAERGLQVAIESGLDGSRGQWLRGNAAGAHLLLGHPKAAARLLDEVARMGPTGFIATYNVIDRARLATYVGRLDEAEQLLASVTELAGGPADGILPSYFEASAALAMWQGRPETAMDLLDRAVEVFDGTEPAWGLAPVLAWTAATIADAPGAGSDDTIALVGEHLANRLGPKATLPPVDRPWTHVVRAELSRLQGHPDPELWEDAAQAWDRLSIPHRAAYCRFRQAEATLITDGPRGRATELLRTVHQVSSRLGAQPLRAEIEALARRGRIQLQPDPARGGPAVPPPHEELGLTPREWEVLQHLAQGATNAQIARILFIAEKTVERHVTSILHKLEATNRVEAAGIVHRLDTTTRHSSGMNGGRLPS